jgi:hypothetical protein
MHRAVDVAMWARQINANRWIHMFSREEAIKRIEEHLTVQADGDDWIVVGSQTIERAFGWVFFYNTREFIEGGNFSACLAGNSPYIFNRFTGAIVCTGTAYPIEHYIHEYEATNKG